jgi:hypothetical protein
MFAKIKIIKLPHLLAFPLEIKKKSSRVVARRHPAFPDSEGNQMYRLNFQNYTFNILKYVVNNVDYILAVKVLTNVHILRLIIIINICYVFWIVFLTVSDIKFRL